MSRDPFSKTLGAEEKADVEAWLTGRRALDEVARLRAVLARIAAENLRVVEEDVATWTDLRIAQYRGGILDVIGGILMDFEEGADAPWEVGGAVYERARHAEAQIARVRASQAAHQAFVLRHDSTSRCICLGCDAIRALDDTP